MKCALLLNKTFQSGRLAMLAQPKLVARAFSLASNHYFSSIRRIGPKLGLVLATIGAMASVSAQTYVPNKLEGQFAVSPSGAATYHVPLPLPPGINDHKPKLSLNYNSQGGNGMLGMGWSLGGFSAVTRCAQTKAQDGDGFVPNITNTWTDRFCLDGQRLMRAEPATGSSIAVSPTGPYYAGDNTEYRTELETYSRVQAFGQYANGPAYFIVQTKSGQKMWFGNTADSVTLAADGTTRTSWGVTRIEDIDGNAINFDYNPDYPNGMTYPNTVSYGGSVVTFGYEARPDVPLFYRAGQVHRTTLRLQTITVKSQSGSPNIGTLMYENNGVAGRSLMNQFSLCDPSNQCVMPLKFAWRGTTLGVKNVFYNDGTFRIPDNYSSTAFGVSMSRLGRFADINGDGRSDLIQANRQLGLKNVFLSTGSGFVRSDSYSNSLINSEIWFDEWNSSQLGSDIVDVNSDGLADLVRIYGDLRWVYINNGSGFTYDAAYSASLPPGGRISKSAGPSSRFADIDGDGRVDFIEMYIPTWSGANPVKRIYLNNGSQFVYSASYSSTLPSLYFLIEYDDAGLRLADIDGDGRVDLISSTQSGGGAPSTNYVYLNSGAGFYYAADYSSSLAGVPFVHLRQSGDPAVQIRDINNDGLPDLIQIYYPAFSGSGGGDFGGITKRVLLNTGKSFVYDANYSNSIANTYLNTQWSNNGSGTRLADINGDGYVDIVQIDSEYSCGQFPQICTKEAVYTNTGEKFVYDPKLTSDLAAIAYSTDPVYRHEFRGGTPGFELASLIGDGGIELVADNFYTQISRNRDIVVSFGYGSQQTVYTQSAYDVEYQYLSEANSKYTKLRGASYPKVDLQIPLRIVSNVRKSAGYIGAGRGGGTKIIDSDYRYEGLKAEQGTGRGMLGFSKISATVSPSSERGALRTDTRYSQDWPTLGMVTNDETYQTLPTSGTGLIKKVTNNLRCLKPHDASACTVAAGNRYFPYVQSTSEERWDLNGATLPTSTSSVEYWRNPTDVQFWGDPNKTTTALSDGSSKVTENTYKTAITNNGSWILGRLTRSKVTSKQSLANTGGGIFPGGVSVQPPPPTPPVPPTPTPAQLQAAKAALPGILSLLLND
jgi:hypothetical protein